MSTTTTKEKKKKTYTLKTCDDVLVDVDESVAMMSETIMENIAENPIELPEVCASILEKVIEYCQKHIASSSDKDDDLKEWDAAFINVDQFTLFDIIVAAFFLGVDGLLDLAYAKASGT